MRGRSRRSRSRGASAPTASCRANAILDAATEIAAERGYEGTSIALVSKKCGLPASSIYWHFKDKDDLIAAVIERSFGSGLSAWQIPEGDGAEERFVGVAGPDRQGAAGFARLHSAWV